MSIGSRFRHNLVAHPFGFPGRRAGIVLALAAIAITVPTALGSQGVLDGQISAGDPGFGNGAFAATIVGMSTDGQVVAFSTPDPLVAEDSGTSDDLYVRTPAGLFLLGLPVPASTPGSPRFLPNLTRVLPDGHVVFGTATRVLAADGDGLVDLYIADRDGAISGISDTGTDIGPGSADVQQQPLVVSDDGSTLLFATQQNLIGEDTDSGDDTYRYRVATGVLDLVTDGVRTGTPAGLNADGNSVYLHSSDANDGCGEAELRTDVFRTTDGGATITPISCFVALAGPATGIFFAGVSPDGNQVVLQTAEKLTAADTDGDIDLYANDSGSLAWISEPAVAGGGSADPKLLRSCNGTAVFTEAERMTLSDTDSSADVFHYGFGSGASQLSVVGADGTPAEFDAIPAGVSANCGELLWTTKERVLAADNEALAAEDLYLSDGVPANTVFASPTPPGGINGPILDAFGASPNLEQVYLETTGRYTDGDGDALADVYEWKRASNQLSLISEATPAIAGGGGQESPGLGPDGKPVGATPDGSAVIVKTGERLLETDDDSFNLDLYRYNVEPGPEPTTTTLSVAKTARMLKASGQVEPSQVGAEMTVTLYRKRDGVFRKVSTRHPVLDASSDYGTRFGRPDSGRCRIRSRFPGDTDANPSTATKEIRC